MRPCKMAQPRVQTIFRATGGIEAATRMHFNQQVHHVDTYRAQTRQSPVHVCLSSGFSASKPQGPVPVNLAALDTFRHSRHAVTSRLQHAHALSAANPEQLQCWRGAWQYTCSDWIGHPHPARGCDVHVHHVVRDGEAGGYVLRMESLHKLGVLLALLFQAGVPLLQVPLASGCIMILCQHAVCKRPLLVCLGFSVP